MAHIYKSLFTNKLYEEMRMISRKEILDKFRFILYNTVFELRSGTMKIMYCPTVGEKIFCQHTSKINLDRWHCPIYQLAGVKSAAVGLSLKTIKQGLYHWGPRLKQSVSCIPNKCNGLEIRRKGV